MAENLGNAEEQVEVITEGLTEDVTDKKCPNCGATVVYDPETLAMSCPFCGYSRQLPKPEDNGQDVEELDFSSAKNRESLDWGKAKKSLVCKNCGAETIMDEADTAQCCPYCGSTQVMPVDNDEDVVAPGGVVPFEITKEKAAQIFKSWMKGKLFAPNEAKKSCEAKNFNGMYLPYWTYDSQTTSPYQVELGYRHERTNSKGESETYYEYKHFSGIYEKFVDDEVVRDVHEPAAVDGHIGIETVKGSVDDVVEFMCDDEYGLMQRKRGKERRRNKHASGGRNGRRLNARVKAYVHDRKWLDGVGEQRLDQCERRLQFVCCVVVVQGVALIMSSKVLTSALSAPSSAHCCT